MNSRRSAGFGMLLVASLLSVQGCAVFFPLSDKHGIPITPAERPADTITEILLKDMPPPLGQVSAAVYGFRDLTGQNKPSPSSGLSTAVTQGASHLLVKALLESKWFLPLERIGLQNVLTERDLWSRQAGGADKVKDMPAMPAATILIEGGIVAYDFNIRTGGFGAKYLGIGGSQNYREDILTVNLRAVNARNGSILHSVNSTKRIFSKNLNLGLFAFVEYDQIAELEGGYGFNEPVQRGVEEAIQGAIIDLVAKGIVKGVWKLKNPEEIVSTSFTSYLSNEEVDEYLIAKGLPLPDRSNMAITSDTAMASDNAELFWDEVRATPEIVSPTVDGQLIGEGQIISWTNNKTPAMQWLVEAGTFEDSDAYYNSGRIKDSGTRSVRITGLPENDSPVLVRLSWKSPEGPWDGDSFSFVSVKELNSYNAASAPVDNSNKALGLVESATKNHTPALGDELEPFVEPMLQASSEAKNEEVVRPRPSVPQAVAKTEPEVTQEGEKQNEIVSKTPPDIVPPKTEQVGRKEPSVTEQLRFPLALEFGQADSLEKGQEFRQVIDDTFGGIDVKLIKFNDQYRVRVEPVESQDDLDIIVKHLREIGFKAFDIYLL